MTHLLEKQRRAKTSTTPPNVAPFQRSVSGEALSINVRLQVPPPANTNKENA